MNAGVGPIPPRWAAPRRARRPRTLCGGLPVPNSNDGRTPLSRGYSVVARTGELDPMEKLLWFIIRGYENADGRGCFAGDELLASHMGRSVRSVQGYRASLHKKGYLRRQLRGPKPAYWWATIPEAGEDSEPEDGGSRGFPSGRFVEAIREFWWLGQDLPPRAPDGWALSADLQYLRRLWANEETDVVLSFMEGTRTLAEASKLPKVDPGDPFTSAYLQRNSEYEDRSLWSRALEAARNGKPNESSPLGGLVDGILVEKGVTAYE